MSAELTELWAKTLEAVAAQLPRPSFETWIKNTKPVGLEDHRLLVCVPNEFARDWIEKRYSALLTSIVRQVTGQEFKIEFILPSNGNGAEAPRPAAPPLIFDQSRPPGNGEAGPVSTLLNPKYKFETFVIGSGNRFAHAAALAVADAPARAYNPLFIYGGVGLGKTHLMQAIGHHVLEHWTQLRVVYVTSETFTNELINSIRDHRTVEFRNRYRTVDVLLIDDIQFLAGKESTQEEFFHTFNALHAANKQIVISSDRPPKEIPTLEERLRSRFEGGLISDIQPPDLETRVAILRKKVGLETLNVPDEVLLYIATKIDTNIRELEGAMIRLVAVASLTRAPLNLELAAETLRDMLPSARRKPISVELIQQVVAQHYGLSVEDLNVRKRTRAVAFPRQVAMFLTRELTEHSLPRIGDEFGGRDHTTVLHAYEKISADMARDPSLEQVVRQLAQKIRCQ